MKNFSADHRITLKCKLQYPNLYTGKPHRAWCFPGEVREAVFRNDRSLVYSALPQNSLRDEPLSPGAYTPPTPTSQETARSTGPGPPSAGLLLVSEHPHLKVPERKPRWACLSRQATQTLVPSLDSGSDFHFSESHFWIHCFFQHLGVFALSLRLGD